MTQRTYILALDDSLTQEEADRLLQTIRSMPGVQKVTPYSEDNQDFEEDTTIVQLPEASEELIIPTQIYVPQPPAYMSREHCIYEWYIHETGEIKYIGSTSQGLEKRTRDHLNEAFKFREFYEWIRSRSDEGELPGVRQVDVAPNSREAHRKEQQHKQDAIRAGHRLFNKEARTPSSLMFNRILLSRLPPTCFR